MSIVSFAQNFEDVLLWRALGDVEQGCYLDIGAQDPVVDSVSLAFYNAGWRGVHVEASPAYAERLRKARPDETVIEAAVTDAKGPIPFYSFEGTGISTGIANVANSHKDRGHQFSEIHVPTATLAHIFSTIDRDIHWLKIDVEGMEPEVLRSWGRSEVRPWILIIEATVPLTQTPNETLWLSEVLSRGYEEVFFDAINRFFVHTSHKELSEHFSTPVNFFDGFAIGKNHFAASFLCDDQNSETQGLADVDASNTKAEIFRLHGAIHGLQVTESDLRAGLDLARAERETIRVELAALHEQSRNAIEAAWRERSANENALRLEFLAREDQASQAARAAIASANAAKIELAKAERNFVESQRMAATEQLTSQERAWRERLEFETALRREYQQKDKDAAETLRIARSNFTISQADLARTQERLRQALERAQQAEGERAKTLSLLAASQQSALNASATAERLEHELRSQIDEAVTEANRLERELRSQISEAAALSDQVGHELRSQIDEVAAEGERAVGRLKSELSGVQSELAKTHADLVSAHTVIQEMINDRRSAWKLLFLILNPAKRRQISGPNIRAHLSQRSPASDPIVSPSANSLDVGRTMLNSFNDARDPYLRADSLFQLLGWDDRDFVRCAYVTLLGRQPDRLGEDYYTELVRGGRSKLHVLRQIRRSREASDHDPGIAGLDRALRKAHWEQSPLFGFFVRFLTRGERDGIASRRNRALLNQIARLGQAQGESQVEFRTAMDAHRELAAGIWQVLSDLEKKFSESRESAQAEIMQAMNTQKEFTGGVWHVMSSFEKMLLECQNDIGQVSAAQKDLAENVRGFMTNFEDALKPRPEDRGVAETRLTPKAQVLYNRLVSR